MSRMLIMGPPGAGKGTQAANIVKYYDVPHISTGDMFRAAIKNQTELGVLAKSYMDKGELVPDSVTIGIVKERLLQDDCKKGFLLDGFPRNLKQAEAFDEMLKSLGITIDFVINIEVDPQILIDRVVGRRVCPACGATFHVLYNKPLEDGICDECHEALIQRKDDTVETATNRLKVYDAQTAPLLDYYKSQVFNVDGSRSLDEVFAAIKARLGDK